MAGFISSIFATHHQNWADVQAVLNILLVPDERWLIIDKANKEAQSLHQENPDRNPNPGVVIPLIETNWDSNSRDLTFLEH